jgi:hypothetical protein
MDHIKDIPAEPEEITEEELEYTHQYMYDDDFLESCMDNGVIRTNRMNDPDHPAGRIPHPYLNRLGDGGKNWDKNGPTPSVRQRESIKDERNMQRQVQEAITNMEAEVMNTLILLGSPLEVSETEAKEYMTNIIVTGIASNNHEEDKKFLNERLAYADERNKDWEWSIDDIHKLGTRLFKDQINSTNYDQENDISRFEAMFSNAREAINREKLILRQEGEITSGTLDNLECIYTDMLHVGWTNKEKLLHMKNVQRNRNQYINRNFNKVFPYKPTTEGSVIQAGIPNDGRPSVKVRETGEWQGNDLTYSIQLQSNIIFGIYEKALEDKRLLFGLMTEKLLHCPTKDVVLKWMLIIWEL